MVYLYFCMHVKCTKGTWFCSENTVKTLAKLCIPCILYGTCVFLYTYEMNQRYMILQWKHSKNTSKTVHFMYNIWYMCIFVYMWNVPRVHFSLVKTQWKHSENISKTVHFMYNIWYTCIFVCMWNVPKVHVSAVKTQWKPMKTLAKLCISCIIYDTCVFLYTC
jgi:hypothetical protein